MQLAEPKEFKLSNGIPVVVQNLSLPVAAVYWWNRTGSADERPVEAGFAHFLEHMLFKDATAKESGMPSTGGLARSIESLGGDINAYTSFDQTVYHVTCSERHWEKVFSAFGELATPQRFLKEDFEREREVILEELRKNEDSPGRMLFQNLFGISFKKHPYGRPVIGTRKSLNAATVRTLEAFYKRRYVAERMGVVLVGPLGLNESAGSGSAFESPRLTGLLKLAEKYFGAKVLKPTRFKSSTPRRTAVDTRAQEPAERKDIATVLLPFDVHAPTLSVSFRAPSIDHEDVPGLDLLSGVLGTGELSRLYQRLFYQDALVSDAGSGVYIPSDPGMVYLQVDVVPVENPEKPEEAHEATGKRIGKVFAAIIEEINRLMNEGVTAEELSRVIALAESERLYSGQSADSLASRVGFMRFIVNDYNFDSKYLAALRGMSARQLQQIARKYFAPSRMSIAVLVPKALSTFEVEALADYARKELKGGADSSRSVGRLVPLGSPRQTVKKKGKTALVAPPQLWTAPSGIRYSHRYRSDSPVFSVHASALGGLRLEYMLEEGRLWGASHLMAQTWSKGTDRLSSRQVSEIVESSASSLEGFSGRNSIGLQVTGLERDWDKLSDLFIESLCRPAFPEDELGHVRRVVEDSIRSLDDHASQVAFKLFLENLFGAHPYGKITQGSLESIAEICKPGSRWLNRLHGLWVRPSRMVVSVSGNIDQHRLEEFSAKLDDAFAARRAVIAGVPVGAARFEGVGAQPSDESGKAIPGADSLFMSGTEIVNPSEPTLSAPRWVERSLGREQVHIVVGGLGIHVNDEDRAATKIMSSILGGQSGRLFIELREKKSLAYSVGPVSFEGIERGYLGTYMACAPDKRQVAIDGIRKSLENLAKSGPSALEMGRAREVVLGKRSMDLQGDSSLAASDGLELLYGIGPQSDEDHAREVSEVRAADVKRVCSKYLVEAPQVTCWVG